MPPTSPRQKSTANTASRPPIFYGWVIMMAGTLGLVMTSPGQTYTVSIFIEHIIEDLGLSRSVVSSLYSGGTLLGSLMLPFWGRQIDRRGPRRMVLVIALLFGLACIYMGFVQNALMLGLGFFLIRMLGQGSLELVSQNVINQWWVRRRGLVLGISGSLLAVLGMGGVPNLVHWLIQMVGWRMAYPLLGVALLLGMAPLGALLFRNRPEDYGLTPDGDAQPNDVPGVPAAADRDWTLAEVLRTRAFWVVALNMAAVSAISTAVYFHVVSIFRDQGFSPAVAAAVFVPVALTSAGATLAGGYLTDRISVRLLLSGAMALYAASLALIPFMSTVAGAYFFGIIFGLSGGAIRVLYAVIWPTYFGRRHLGSIVGLTGAISIVGAASGPIAFGIARDLLGNYHLVLFATAATAIFFSALALVLKRPVHQPLP